MKHKRVWSLVLILALAMSLAACGNGQKPVSGNAAPTAAPTTVPTTAPAETAPAGNPMSLGRIDGNTYINDYMGFTMTLDDTWIFSSAEELQELPDNIAELLEGSEVGEALENFEQFTDMMAESVEELASINVLYQKLDMSTRLAYATMTNEQILDSTLEQSEMLKEAYAQAGMEVQSMEKVTVTFLGEEVAAVRTHMRIQGMDYYTLQVMDYHLGQYTATITFASYVEDKTKSLLDLCQLMD